MSVLEQVKTAPMSRVQVKAVALCLVMNLVDGFDLLLTSLVGPAIARERGPVAVAGGHPAQQRSGRHGVRCAVPRPARRPDRPPQAHTRRSRGGLQRTALLGIVVDAARAHGVPVVYPTHVHRPGDADMGIHRELYPPVAAGEALVDGGRGVEIYPEITPQAGELVVKKRCYNSFYATDLEIVLRGLGVDTVVLTGMTECCVLGTARGALECGFRSVVLAAACASCDYPDLGFGAMPASEMHLAALRIMSLTSSEVTDADTFLSRLP